CEQCKSENPCLDAAISTIRGCDGKKRFAKLLSVLTVSFRPGFASPLAEKLADHFFDGHFLDVDIADITSFEQLPAGLGDFGARHLQLDGNRRLFDYFAKCGKVARGLLLEGQTD